MIEDSLDKYEKIAAEQLDRVRLLKMLAAGELDPGNVVEKITRENEELYLGMKSICYEMQSKEADNPIEEMGTTDSFDSSLNKICPGVWKFTLPPFYSISVKKRFSNEGRHIYYLMLNLLQNYEIESEKIEIMLRPVVCFRHHICTEKDRIFDFDNIDSKRAVDALQGFFLKGDDALYLTTVHEAVKDPDRSYCEIFVFDRAKTCFEIEGITFEKCADTGQKR